MLAQGIALGKDSQHGRDLVSANLQGYVLAPTARLILAQGIALGKIPNMADKGLKARHKRLFSTLF